MPAMLLEQLEAADSLSESLAKVNDSLHRNAQVLGQILERMKGTARAFEKAWQQIVAKVAKGETAEIQAARLQLLSDFETRLGLLKQGHSLLAKEQRAGWTDLDPDFLLSEIADMERMKARVFDLWQSAEDLEDLAARDYPLTTADLNQIGPQRRPPASWYAEESKPY